MVTLRTTVIPCEVLVCSTLMWISLGFIGFQCNMQYICMCVALLITQVSEVNAKCDELERKLYDRTEMLKIEISRRDVQVKTVREEMNRLEESKRDTEARVCVTLLEIIQYIHIF